MEWTESRCIQEQVCVWYQLPPTAFWVRSNHFQIKNVGSHVIGWGWRVDLTRPVECYPWYCTRRVIPARDYKECVLYCCVGPMLNAELARNKCLFIFLKKIHTPQATDQRYGVPLQRNSSWEPRPDLETSRRFIASQIWDSLPIVASHLTWGEAVNHEVPHDMRHLIIYCLVRRGTS